MKMKWIILSLLGLAFGSLAQEIEIGATYSYPHALWLFDGDEAKAKAVLEQAAQAGIKYFRLMILWNWAEKDSGQFDFSSLDWQLQIMQKYNVKTVILCLGRKVPRWPEYHIPGWTKQLPEEKFRKGLLRYLEILVCHFSTDKRITHFQVENEPLFGFGEGKFFWQKRFRDQEEFLAEEIFTVRTYDELRRPIIVTDPGDWGNYDDAAKDADILGVSYYRTIYNAVLYLPNHWLYKSFFRFFTGNFLRGPRFQAESISQFIGNKPVWLVEIQDEPWGPKDNRSLSPAESAKSMNPAILKKNLAAVKKAGFTGPIFLWGIEWMAWMKDNGHPEMWKALEGLTRK